MERIVGVQNRNPAAGVDEHGLTIDHHAPSDGRRGNGRYSAPSREYQSALQDCQAGTSPRSPARSLWFHGDDVHNGPFRKAGITLQNDNAVINATAINHCWIPRHLGYGPQPQYPYYTRRLADSQRRLGLRDRSRILHCSWSAVLRFSRVRASGWPWGPCRGRLWHLPGVSELSRNKASCRQRAGVRPAALEAGARLGRSSHGPIPPYY